MFKLLGPVRFLHLTDLHLTGDPGALQVWTRFASYVRGLNLHWDFLFLTGDVSDKNSQRGYDKFADTIGVIAEAMKIPSGQIWCVPGNHDANRNVNVSHNADASNLSFWLKVPEQREILQLAFKSFVSSTTALGCQTHLIAEAPLLSHRSDVRVLPINTAWLARDSDSDDGKLAIGVPYFREQWSNAPGSPDWIVIGLAHHHIDWMHTSERRGFRGLIVKHCDVLLCGHEHSEEIEPIYHKGLTSIVVTGASIGQAPYQYHRALVGEISPAGSVVFHRIVFDPDRENTSDEFMFAPSTQSFLLGRPNEIAMFRPAAGVGPGSILSLRKYWEDTFAEDALRGLGIPSKSRKITTLYRRLYLSPWRTASESDSEAPLWVRLQQLRTRETLNIIASKIAKGAEDCTVSQAYELAVDRPSAVLEGHAVLDIDTIARFGVAVAVTKAFEMADLARINSEGGPNEGDLVSRTLKILSAFARFTPAVGARDLSPDRRSYPPVLADFSGTVEWQYLIQLYADGPRTPAFLSDAARRVRDSYGVQRLSRFQYSDIILDEVAFRLPQLELSDFYYTLHAELAQNKGFAEVRPDEKPLVDMKAWYETLVKTGRLTLAEARCAVDICSKSMPDYARAGGPILELAFSLGFRLCGAVKLSPLIRAIGAAMVERCFGLEPGYVLCCIPSLAPPGLLDEAAISVNLLKPQLDSVAANLRESVAVDAIVEHCINRTLAQHAHMDGELSLSSFEEIRTERRLFAICGAAGTGKTTMLQHLCLTCGDNEIPIFIRLRDWAPGEGLEKAISRQLENANAPERELDRLLARAHSEGLLPTILLDGLDEVADFGEEHKRALQRLFTVTAKSANVIVTTRPSAIDRLPAVAHSVCYYLHRLRYTDIESYITAWHGQGSESGRKVVSLIQKDPALMENLRTPMVLRMFCDLTETKSWLEKSDSADWPNRAYFYESLAEYQLHRRDAARGIAVTSLLADKMDMLEHIATGTYDDDLRIIPADRVLAYIGVNFGTFAQSDELRERKLATLREIFERSGILVRFPDSRFDFCHYTFREYFACRAWARGRSWTEWSEETRQRRFLQESVPRFIVGLLPHTEAIQLLPVLEVCLAATPHASLLRVQAALEIWDQLGPLAKLEETSRLLDAAVNEQVPIAEARNLFSQLAAKPDGASLLATRWRIRFLKELQQDPAAGGLSRLVAAVSDLDTREMGDTLTDVLRLVPGLEQMVPGLLSRMTPKSVGAIVLALADDGSVDVIRQCAIASNEWLVFLKERIQSALKLDLSKQAAPALISDEGILGTDEDVAGLRAAVEAFLQQEFAGRQLQDLTDAARLQRIGKSISGELRSRIQASLVSFATERERPAIELSREPKLVELIAEEYGFAVRAEPPAKRSQFRTETAVGILVDAAYPLAVEMLVQGTKSTNERLAQLCTSGLRLCEERFVSFLPVDTTAAAIQMVQDCWISLDRQRQDTLMGAKAERLSLNMKRLNMGAILENKFSATVARLPRFPEAADWFFLQHRFGSIVGALARGAAKRRESSPSYNIILEESWDVIYETLRKSGA